jgi:hypothetical protein
LQDISYKNKKGEIMSDLTLEELLFKAAQEPEYRDAFYEKLLESDLYVLGGDGVSDGDVADDELSLVEWTSEEGEKAIPFFSSYKLLEKSVGADQLYLELKGAVLLATIRDMNLVMNPGHEASKMFYPEEIEMILTTEFGYDDDGGAEFSEDVAIRPITNKRSVVMLKALKEYFNQNGSVVRAYVAAMDEHDNENEAHLVIGIDVDEDVDSQEIVKDAMNIILEKAPEDETVDIFKIDLTQKEGMSAYFIHEMKPFYIRK